MKIAIFHELPVKSGSRHSVNNIAHVLKERNTVDLYLIGENNSAEEINYFSNIFFYKFKQREWKGKNWKVRLYRDTLELYKLYKLNRKVAEEINKGRYDICFINGSQYTESPFILRFIKKMPKIYYAHASNYSLVFESVVGVPRTDIFRYWYEKLNRLIRKVIDLKNVKSADIILANSKYTKKNIFRIYNRKSILSYLGVDQHIFKPQNVAKKYDVLYIGSEQPVDGLYLLENALKLIKPNLGVRIVTVENEWIQEEKLLNKLYNNSKIVVCTAHKEPFGLTPLEAMACGIPVIAVDEGGYKETVVNNKTGFLVRRNSLELKEKISFLLKNPGKLKEFGINGRRIIRKNWTWEKRVSQLENILIKCIVTHNL